MARLQGSRWLQVGLLLFISPMATAVQAARPSEAHLPTEYSTSSFESQLFNEEILLTQILPDDTLGEAGATIIHNNNGGTYINGGAIRGTNVFHSFQDFNINPGQQVYFTNPSGIKAILSRVTGRNISEIDGLLGVAGTADLFLLNPNGIIFGPQAQLDIQGTFTASTAGRLEFEDGNIFSAVNPQGAALLTMSVPLGVQFSDSPQGNITSTGTLETGQDLNLLGHQLYLEGQLIAGDDLALQAQDTVTIRDTATDAFIARSGDSLTIQGNQGIDIWTLQHLEQTPFVSGGDFTALSDGAISGDAHFDSGGSLRFLTLAGSPGNLVSFYDPIIVADGDVVLGDYTGVALKIETTGSIQAGNIRTRGPDRTLTADGSGSDEDLLASSRAVILRAGTTGSIASEPPGSIEVNRIQTSNINADGGAIILAAEGDITIIDRLVSTSQSNTGDAGNGGDISISSQSGNISTNRINAFSLSNTGNAGNGGDISISSQSGNISTSQNTSSFSLSRMGDAGNGGNISISSESGDISINGALLTFSDARIRAAGMSGDGGSISISSLSGDITTNNISAFSDARFDTGNGGDVSISSDSGDISTGGLIAFSQSLIGNAGNGANVSISSRTGDIAVERFVLFSRSTTGDAGNGGDLVFSSDLGDISIDDNSSTFSLSNRGSAENGGSISLSSISGNISADGSLIAFSDARNVGNTGSGGNVSLASISGDITANKIDSFSLARFDADRGEDVSISSISGDISVGAIATFSGSFLGTASNGGNVSISSVSGDISTQNIDTSSVLTSFLDPTISFVPAGSTSTADGGDISISSVSGNLSTNGFLVSSSFSLAGDVSNGGDVSLITEAGTIIGNNSPISTISISKIGGTTGDGGTVTLGANSISDLEVSTVSSSGISGDVLLQGIGSDLSINNLRLITSGQVVISNPILPGRSILIDLPAFDQSGNTTITSAGHLTLDNVEILTDANREAAAGNVVIVSLGDIQVNNSQILSNTNADSSGNGGTVSIKGTESITLDNSLINTNTDGRGRAGSISILTPVLNIQNGARLTAATSSLSRAGIGGDISIAADEVNLSGDSTTEISVSTNGPAAAGSITLTPFSRGSTVISTLDDGPQFSASTAIGSRGRGGDIIIRDADIALLRNTDFVTSSDGAGDAGNIIVQNVGVLLIRQGSLIQAGASANGNGGDIDIDAKIVLTVPDEDNDILADTNSGIGGNINITADRIIGFREGQAFSSDLRGNGRNDISARSEGGVDGEVSINNFAVDPNQGLTELPTDVTDPAGQIAQGCGMGDRGSGAIANSPTGDFMITGRGGQPISPTDFGSADTLLDDLGPDMAQTVSSTSVRERTVPRNEHPPAHPLADSQAARVTDTGDVFLIADGQAHPSLSCTSLK